jgi:signal transduction histidine kinase
MELKRRNTLIYGILLGAWILAVGWQVEEHLRVRGAAKTDLRNRATEVTKTLSAVMRALRFRNALSQDRLELVLDELVQTNRSGGSSGLISIVLLNTSNAPVVAAGETNLITPETLSENEQWTDDNVTFVNPVYGVTNRTILLPPFGEFTNTFSGTNVFRPPPTNNFRAYFAQRELHGLVLVMSTENFRAANAHDFWLRCVVVCFAGILAIGIGWARQNIFKTSELQIRLVRASELNSHLKEMNLAAAGLAHETRNPLNIIRGMAQMLSKQPEATPEIREKSRAIVDETDKITAQLNEFINYSRPREIRRAKIALHSAVNEVVRALSYDIDEKKIRVEIKGEPLSIEADEQLLRQALFNLLLNAIQAVSENGHIEFVTRRTNVSEASLEIRDDGAGVLPEHRQEIFKPYFTTHQKGTGLGLAVVQQIILAHGWEIENLPNQPKGAIFRITHLKLAV